MIELRDVTKTFQGVNVVNDVTVSFEPGEISGVIGRNGRRTLAIITDVTSPKLKLAASLIYFIRFTKVRLPLSYTI